MSSTKDVARRSCPASEPREPAELSLGLLEARLGFRQQPLPPGQLLFGILDLLLPLRHRSPFPPDRILEFAGAALEQLVIPADRVEALPDLPQRRPLLGLLAWQGELASRFRLLPLDGREGPSRLLEEASRVLGLERSFHRRACLRPPGCGAA